MSTLRTALDEGRVRVGDGPMGTQLQLLGLTDGGAPELWNVEHPEIIAQVLEQYASSGAHFLTTNTFGGSRPRLAMHDLEDRVHELNAAGARVAREVADRHEGCYVLGDVGPSGDLMEPLGTLTQDDAIALFSEQIAGLVDGGVDGILIETMSDLPEVQAAITAAQRTAPGMPIFATMSFDTNLRTMMGVTPQAAAQQVAAMGADVVGANCGRGVDEMRIIATGLLETRPAGTRILLQSNAGLPQLVGSDFIYTGTPEEMAEFAAEMREAGIDIVGACCGSTADHIRAVAGVMA